MVARYGRRVAARVVVLALIWCIGLHAPLCCIVHCHVAPWLLARLSNSAQPQFVCTLDHSANDRDALPPARSLPPVIYSAVIDSCALLTLLLIVTGWLVPAAFAPIFHPVPPPTPPPRSVTSHPWVV
ncbi:MAG: hypothetical protein HXY39_06455 [Chloroflexi bacterium]|nr:hypothetical protein [Chloroflexota bacterium]